MGTAILLQPQWADTRFAPSAVERARHRFAQNHSLCGNEIVVDAAKLQVFPARIAECQSAGRKRQW
jgi:hypothetical protein